MIFLPIVLATIFGFATSVPLDTPDFKERIFNVAGTPNQKVEAFKELLEINNASTRNSILENLLNDVIDMLRDLILNGSDDVPVLDPFKLDELHVDGDIVGLENSHVTLKDLTVNNLGTFEIDKLDVTTVSLLLQRYRIELDGRIPVLDVQTGNYDLLLNIFGGDIFGNGNMKLKIGNSRVYADIVVGLRLSSGGIFVEVRECNVRFNLDTFEAQISGLFGDETASDFVSLFISSLVPEFLEYFEEDVTNILSSTVLQIANDLLNDLNVIDLLP